MKSVSRRRHPRGVDRSTFEFTFDIVDGDKPGDPKFGQRIADTVRSDSRKVDQGPGGGCDGDSITHHDLKF